MLPLNAEARQIANLWDPAKEAAGADQSSARGRPAAAKTCAAGAG